MYAFRSTLHTALFAAVPFPSTALSSVSLMQEEEANGLAKSFEILVDLIVNQDPIGIVVGIVILIFFFIGCFDVLRAWMLLNKEKQLVIEGRRKVKKAEAVILPQINQKKKVANKGGSASAAKPNVQNQDAPVRVMRDLEKFGEQNSNSLLGQRIDRVLRLRQAGVEQIDFLQKLSAEQVVRYGSMSRYIAASLILLGLLGTVFGMSVALGSVQQGLGVVEDPSQWQSLLDSLGATCRV